MSEQVKQENQKTIVAFAAGLLIGGLLVWVFGGSPKVESPEVNNADEKNEAVEVKTDSTQIDVKKDEEATPEAPVTLQTGEGKVTIKDQAVGKTALLENVTFPTDEGWIGVRDYVNGQPGGILGVVRYSKTQGLVPQEIVLQRPTKAGSEYAVVFFKENGDRKFSSVTDKQIEGVFATFKAQ